MAFDREELLSTLTDASPALAKVSVMEGLKHFWFDTKYVYAYDGGLGVRLALKTELECGVPGRPFMELLKTSALKEVFLDLVKGSLVLQMGKSKVSLASMQSDLFFGFMEGKVEKVGLWPFTLSGKQKGAKSIVLSEDLISALDKLTFVKTRGDKPMHHGITLVPVKGGFELYSTDSRSLAQMRVSATSAELSQRVILPWNFVEQILDSVQPGAVLSIGEYLMAEGEAGTRIFSNLLENQETPDIAKVATSYRDVAKLIAGLPPTLRPLLERVIILAGQEDADVVLTSKDDKLTVSGKYKLGHINEQLPINGKLPSVSGKFDAALVMRALGEADEFTFDAKSITLFGHKKHFMYVVSARGT